MTSSTREPGRAVAVIVTYNNEETIGDCLESLSKAAASTDLDWTAVVVDNSSSDATVEQVRRVTDRLSLDVELIRNDDNRGFAAAVNQGLAPHDTAWVLLLNPDCFLYDDALSTALDGAARHPGDGIVVQLYNLDGTVQPSAGTMPVPTRLLARQLRRAHRGPYLNRDHAGLATQDLAVEWAHFAFFLVDGDTWRRLGGLDERYWLYSEDMDFCHRLALAGRQLWWVPGSGAAHIHGHSSRQTRLRAARRSLLAWLLFLRSTGQRGQALVLLLSAPFIWTKAAVRFARQGRR